MKGALKISYHCHHYHYFYNYYYPQHHHQLPVLHVICYSFAMRTTCSFSIDLLYPDNNVLLMIKFSVTRQSYYKNVCDSVTGAACRLHMMQHFKPSHASCLSVTFHKSPQCCLN